MFRKVIIFISLLCCLSSVGQEDTLRVKSKRIIRHVFFTSGSQVSIGETLSLRYNKKGDTIRHSYFDSPIYSKFNKKISYRKNKKIVKVEMVGELKRKSTYNKQGLLVKSRTNLNKNNDHHISSNIRSGAGYERNENGDLIK